MFLGSTTFYYWEQVINSLLMFSKMLRQLIMSITQLDRKYRLNLKEKETF